MAKELKKISFAIEHDNGDTYMGFMLSIKDDGTVDVIALSECSLADIDTDCLFNTDNELFRIQANT